MPIAQRPIAEPAKPSCRRRRSGLPRARRTVASESPAGTRRTLSGRAAGGEELRSDARERQRALEGVLGRRACKRVLAGEARVAVRVALALDRLVDARERE